MARLLDTTIDGTLGVTGQSTFSSIVNAKNLIILNNSKDLAGLDTSGNRKAVCGISSANNIYIGSAQADYATGNTNIYASAGKVVINGTTYTQIGSTSSYSASVYLGYASGWASTASIGSFWADSTGHNLLEKNSDGLTAYFGWAGSSSYASVTVMRGRTCKYSNSSGATTLSDKNLKKDFVEFDDKYDEFFDNLKPITYKYILGSSSRPHSGFITQEVEEALETAGLTTNDFAGVNIMPINGRETELDEDNNIERDVEGSSANYLLDKGIHEEHDLIYTEFIALNTWQIQKLKAENKELKEQVNELQSMLLELQSKVIELESK